MPAPAATTVVITDANVLINFVHIGQVALLGDLPYIPQVGGPI